MYYHAVVNSRFRHWKCDLSKIKSYNLINEISNNQKDSFFGLVLLWFELQSLVG